ncbi:glycosyltransferase family 8 protein [Bombilactobacillus folatiphilus]|uniref:Glycosyltransferase family 8 protein n=1 Tax=Bombilactobacillus folatiphilus TaxID=2923362 RepID=A0ABY4P7L8_9LACO|nr:glycosyltransferase [Bombilactobacillus folatiphilus]UQS81519.1 glycosyltransferase family 8 protein [Bombilactobacillus folatiphilus]
MSINILYCGDDQMFHGILLSLLSITKHTKTACNFYLVTASLTNKKRKFQAFSDEHVDFLTNVLHQKNPQHTLTKIDLTAIFNKYPPIANLNTMFTPYSMLRLYIDLVPQIPSRLLYLDADVICHHDFTDFYNQSLTDTELVGVLDYYGRWFFHYHWQKFDYLNSGMLLLNMNYIRQTGLFAKCRTYCRRHKLIMPDQSAINKFAHTKRLTQSKFNEQHGVTTETVFQHFSTNWKLWPVIHTVTVKPWEVDKVFQLDLTADDQDVFLEYLTLI